MSDRQALSDAEHRLGKDEPTLEPLHYTARAGLLAELSRQTYDSLYKAIREAILNGIDAGAEKIQLDLGLDIDEDEIVLSDDGEGMDINGLRRSFMSLGGSAKFNDASKFGRIGIGSLALLTYGREAIVETKRSGQAEMVEAHLFHPQTLDREQRAQALDEFPAGQVSTRLYPGETADHFTRIRLVGLTPEVRRVISEPTEFYALIDQLRRVLPLPLGKSRLLEALSEEHPDLVDALDAHTRKWSVPVSVNSSLHENLELSKRTYGDDEGEQWSGRVHPVFKKLRIVRPGERRQITIAGFLVNQRHATPAWSGLTARVQNVAVEEHTFFDLDSDPGFRKYITGEVFLLGDVDVDHLININRTSFNRESRDYQTAQRFVADELEQFKRSRVALGQRRKVDVRRVVENYRRLLTEVTGMLAHADRLLEGRGCNGLPSSRNGSLSYAPTSDIVARLKTLGARPVVDENVPSAGYVVEQPENQDRLTVRLTPGIARPYGEVGRKAYALSFRQGRPSGPAVVVKNRPREIVFNTGHPAIGDDCGSPRASYALVLELAYLLSDGGGQDEFYDRMLSFIAAR